MSEPTTSPAVQSVKAEQKRQHTAASSSSLDKGLEATFPASDPLSATVTSIPAGSGESAGAGLSGRAADLAEDRPYPLVEEALQSRSPMGPEVLDAGEEVRALRRDVARLRENLLEVTEGGVELVKAEAKSAARHVEKRIRERPFTALCVAALVGYLWGLNR